MLRMDHPDAESGRPTRHVGGDDAARARRARHMASTLDLFERTDPVEQWKRVALRALWKGPRSRLPPFVIWTALLFTRAFARVIDASDASRGALTLVSLAESRLNTGDSSGATELATRALDVARSGSLRARAWKVLVWGAVAEQDPIGAHQALGQLPSHAIDVHLVAAYLGVCNRIGEAIGLLRKGREAGQRAPETTKLLTELLFRSGLGNDAMVVARADRHLLSASEWDAVEAAVGPGAAPRTPGLSLRPRSS